MLYSLTREDIHKGYGILVNRTHPLKADEDSMAGKLSPAVPDPLPGTPYPDVLLEAVAARQLQALLEACGSAGEIIPVSGYRTQKDQEDIYDSSLRENGEEFTKKYVAYPGTSEHQTGLAIDVGKAAEEIDFIRPDFPYEGVCQRFRELAPSFGFIERYQAGREDSTGIAQEPWHFRYVGVPHSLLIAGQDLTMEQYIQWIKQYPSQNPCLLAPGWTVYFLSLPETALQLVLPEEAFLTGNNEDGFIVALPAHAKPVVKSR